MKIKKTRSSISEYKTYRAITAIVIFLPFIFISCRFINYDFWNDEVYTLKHFTFVPFAAVMTDYHVPNNHIFFNLINKCYLSVLDIGSLFYLMDYPFIIRLIPFIFSIGTLLYVFFTGKLFFNELTGLVALIILTTTIPFYNFFLQIRGYSASMFFLSMLVFHAMRYEKNSSHKDFIFIFLSTFFAAYTIPLNMYYILSLVLFNLIFIIGPIFKRGKKEKNENYTHFEKKHLFMLTAITAGIGMSLLFYIPLFKEVFFNEYVKNPGWFGSPYPSMFFFVTDSFLSYRYLLIPVFFTGLFFLYRRRKILETIIIKRVFILLLLFIFPFIISFVRNDAPPDRTFVIVFPVLALLIASTLHIIVESITFLRKYHLLIILILFIYCTATFAFAFTDNQQQICTNINASIREQTIYRNYYLSCYQPGKLVKEFTKIIRSKPAPLVIYDSDYHGLREYLDKYELKYSNSDTLEKTFRQNSSAYVIAISPVSFVEWMEKNYPQMKVENKNPFKDFHNLFYCEKIE